MKKFIKRFLPEIIFIFGVWLWVESARPTLFDDSTWPSGISVVIVVVSIFMFIHRAKK